MLFKLSIKNLRKSVKDYAIYFFTLILGVAIFYVFNALESTTVLMDMNETKVHLIEMLNTVLHYLSIFVSFILGFLIIYASQFLIKRRKKEFGTYMLLGMSKKDISKILLMETFLIGLVSLVVGLLLGVVASQFMSILVARMFEADMSKYVFTFSMNAMAMTILFFAIIYITVMIFNTFSVSKAKLIDLINASRQNEKVRLKNVYMSVVLFILSIGMLGYAYYRVTDGIYTMGLELNEFGYCIILGCVGTFLFFYSLSGFLLKLVQSCKAWYLRNLNMFVLRQMNAKINTTVVTMSIICLMLFLTICVLSSGLAINQSMTRDLKTYSPVDAVVTYDFLYGGNDGLSQTQNDLEKVFEQFMSQEQNQLEEMVYFATYTDESVTYGSTTPAYQEMVEKMGSSASVGNSYEEIIPLSQYNTLAKMYGQPTYTLEDDEYLILCDFDEMKPYRNQALEKGQPITIGDQTYHPKYTQCQEGFLYITPMAMNIGVVVVPDEALTGVMPTKISAAMNYSEKMLDHVEEMDEWVVQKAYSGKLYDLINEDGGGIMVVTKAQNYEGSIGTGALTTFIGLYLGVIFLISSAAILALKELSESTDNRSRYMVLRKIGVDEKSIHHALFAQIGIFFLLPVALAIVHAYFGIRFAHALLPYFFNSGLVASIFMTGLFLTVIYGGYLLITYFCSKRIIR